MNTMRKITVLSMITLDGVMQAPGGPDEDTSGGFKYGGWVAPFEDEASGKIMQRLMQPSDLLLGRRTFQIWENYWPHHTDYWPSINDVTKYVATTGVSETDWPNTRFLSSIDDIRKLKGTPGSDLQVWGSGALIQDLLRNDLVDELWLIFYPLTLGQGKKLFADGTIPANFKLAESATTPSGLIFGHFLRAGEVRTGTAGL